MGFVRKNLGVDITGGGAARAAKSSGKRSARAGKKARKFLKKSTKPFSNLGIESAGLLGDFLQQDQGISLPQLQDPSQIINNPFFQALQQQGVQGTLNERAALGLGGSGGTEDALTRQTLLLGNQFQQQDFQNQQQNFANQQSQQQNRFNQLFGTTQFGGNIGLQSAIAQGNLRTGEANALNVGNAAQAQQQARLGGQVLQLGGQALGAFAGGALGGPAGAVAGSGALPGNNTVSGQGGGFFGSGAIPSSLGSFLG